MLREMLMKRIYFIYFLHYKYDSEHKNTAFDTKDFP